MGQMLEEIFGGNEAHFVVAGGADPGDRMLRCKRKTGVGAPGYNVFGLQVFRV